MPYSRLSSSRATACRAGPARRLVGASGVFGCSFVGTVPGTRPLRSARGLQTTDAEPGEFGLTELASAGWHGLIFVADSWTAAPLQEPAGTLDAVVALQKIERLARGSSVWGWPAVTSTRCPTVGVQTGVRTTRTPSVGRSAMNMACSPACSSLVSLAWKWAQVVRLKVVTCTRTVEDVVR